jgi:hypothetical protein
MDPAQKQFAESPLSLEYSSPQRLRPHPALLVLSFIAGIAPLTSGIGSLVLFGLTSRPVFIWMGLYTLFFGGLTVVCGLILIGVYRAQARRATLDREILLRRSWIAGNILLLNFPIALICAFLGYILLLMQFRMD